MGQEKNFLFFLVPFVVFEASIIVKEKKEIIQICIVSFILYKFRTYIISNNSPRTASSISAACSMESPQMQK